MVSYITKTQLKNKIKKLLDPKNINEITNLNLRSSDAYITALHEIAESFNINLDEFEFKPND
jgi:hypothetical protein